MKPMSQERRLLDAMMAGMKITRLSALTELGIFELSARVKMIESWGYTIQRKTIEVTNRWGEKTRVKQYWIDCNG